MYQAIDITATGTIAAGPGGLGGVHLVAGAGAAASLVLRDGGASGRVLARLSAAAGAVDDVTPGRPIAIGADVHATLSGTGATAVAWMA